MLNLLMDKTWYPTAARRLTITVAAALPVLAVVGGTWRSEPSALLPRVVVPALAALALYSLLERWPRRLPARLPRWALQVAAATAVVPLVVLGFYLSTVNDGQTPFWDQPERLTGFVLLSVMGMLVASWTAMAALMRQRDAAVREAAGRELALRRQVDDARLRLLQAQVQPHFLFNTLANVQALVDAGSPRASSVLGSLVDYLRAAVPRLSEPGHTLGRELETVRAYLALMRLRMPDRLAVSVDAEPGLDAAACPPLALMTLVENAVRHGIDPSVHGGRIDVRVRRLDGGRLLASVRDTGVGLSALSTGLGTGLSNLRERLAATWGDAASLRLIEVDGEAGIPGPRSDPERGTAGGLLAEVEFPMERP